MAFESLWRRGGFVRALVCVMLPFGPVMGCQDESSGGGTAAEDALFSDVSPVPAEATGSIGVSGDGPPEFRFGRIAALAFGQDGDIFVLDALAREVRTFDENGAFLHRFGSAGEGPGELGAPRWLHSGTAHVAVLDNDGQMAIYAPGGELLGERRLPSLPLGRAFYFSSPGDVSEGRVLGVTVGTTGTRETASQIAVIAISDDEVVDTVAVGPSGDVFFRSPTGSLAMGSSICDGMYAGVSSSDDVFVADGASGSVTRFRWEAEGVSLQEEWTVTQPGTATPQARIRELRDRVPEPMDHPQGELVPPELESPICDLQVGIDGRVWVRLQNPEEGELWGVFAPGLRESPRTVRFPPDAEVLAFDRSRAAAVVRDDLGVETVRIYGVPE